KSRMVQQLRRADGYDAQVQLLSPTGTANPMLQGDEVLLDVDGSSTRVAALQPKVAAILGTWGHALGADAVHGTAEGTALRWDASWGAKPTTHPIPANLSPIDASCATHWLTGLGAWQK